MKRINVEITSENIEFLKDKKLKSYQLFKFTVNSALDTLRKKEGNKKEKQ